MRDPDQYTVISSSPDIRTYQSEQYNQYLLAKGPATTLFLIGGIFFFATQSDILIISALGWIGLMLEVLFCLGILSRAKDWPKSWPKEWPPKQVDRTQARLLD